MSLVFLNELGQVVGEDGERPLWKTKRNGKEVEVFLEDMHRRHIIHAMNRLRRSNHPGAKLWLDQMRHVYYQKTDEKNGVIK